MITDTILPKSLRIIALLLFMLLTSCEAKAAMNHVELATPEASCQAKLASWHGIIPAQSSKADVINMLDEPLERGYSPEWEKEFFLYPPVVNIAETKYGSLIVFRSDDVVDWIDVWISNLDGKFHTVAEFAQQYGFTLDRVYVAGSADMFGPVQVYIWSECGVAITAVDSSYMKLSENETLPLSEPVETADYQFSFRHPVPAQSSLQPIPDINQLVVREFLFKPTNFDSFLTLYASRVSYFHDRRFYRLNK